MHGPWLLRCRSWLLRHRLRLLGWRPLRLNISRLLIIARRLRRLLIWRLLVITRLFLAGASWCLSPLLGLMLDGLIGTPRNTLRHLSLHGHLSNWTRLRALTGRPADWVNPRSLIHHDPSLHPADIACLTLEIIDHRCAVNDGGVVDDDVPGSYRIMKMAHVHKREERTR